MNIELDPKVFKDVRGVWRTTTLFEETCDRPGYTPVYSLCDEEVSTKGGLPSLKYLYLQARDTQEYLFSELYLGGWDHWQYLQKSWALKPHIEAWRNELKMKLRSEYLLKLREIAAGDGPAALQACKYLYEQDCGLEKRGPKRGRPSKEEVRINLERETSEQANLKEEAKRMGLHIVPSVA